MSLFWRALIMTFEWKDFFRDAYTGTVDTETGYAVVSSQETCFVWKYAQVQCC